MLPQHRSFSICKERKATQRRAPPVMVKVVFLHPDLGIGGAERAVIDAALALKSRNHTVRLVTAHHDPRHCFRETRDGSVEVTAVGDWLPRTLFGSFSALCAYLRMLYAAVYLVFFSSIEYDLIFVDQVSACIPVLRARGAKVLFYCHFPDRLLTGRETFLKAVYRAPIDWLEEKTTGMADCVLVNSRFTAAVFKETFSSLSHIEPTVLYPIPHFTAFHQPVEQPTRDLFPSNKSTVFLSINRYERKKNLGLALKALAKLKDKLDTMDQIHLIVAGGYDERVVENREHYLELNRLATQLNLLDHMTFLRSISDAQKHTLLSHSTCLLYTPNKEHFGIVPIEAMYMNCPVIAVNSGGPLETVDHEKTGFLCEPTAEEFASAMEKFVVNDQLKTNMGKAGHQRVIKLFSSESFTNQLELTVLGLLES